MSRIVVLLVGAVLLLSSASVFAQDAILGQMYGSGVHAYFAGNYLKAHQSLTAAIEGHTQDPRCYYFRGLTYLKLSRPQDASLDFQQGAKLESSDLNRTYNVARALERVQGGDRTTVEQFRVEARMVALEKAEKERKTRYEESRKQEQELLKERAKAAPAKPSELPTEPNKPTVEDPFATTPKPAEKPVTPEKPAVKPSAPEDPFGATPPAKPTEKPEKPAVKPSAQEDPFGATPPAKPTEKPEKPAVKPSAQEDPFGAPAPKPGVGPDKPAVAPGTELSPANKKTPGKKSSLLGGLMDAVGKSVARPGTKPSVTPPVPENPIMPEKPGPGVPAVKPSAKPRAKAPADDPFGGDSTPKPDVKPSAKPGAKAPADDPFVEEPAPEEKSAKPAAKKSSKTAQPAAKKDSKKSADELDPFGGN